jgi:hypothetical protein
MKTESSEHFTSPKTCEAQGPTVEILDYPFSLYRDAQESCPQGAADVRPPLTMKIKSWVAAFLVLTACGGIHESPALLGKLGQALDLDCANYFIDDGSEEGHFSHLGCTGLYSDWGSRTISANARAFAPGYPLSSDETDKSRWIYLPPGTQIDTGGEGREGDLDTWIFPEGTKAWKQFSFGERLVETRLFWKRSNGWFGATYIWSSDQSEALEFTGSTGILVEGASPGGPQYEIPTASACIRCHGGARDKLLGVESINLSAPSATGLVLGQLIAEGLLSGPPAQAPVVPGDSHAAALGFLHSNCGVCCHNPRQQPGAGRLHMRLQVDELGSVESTSVWRTAVRGVSGYQPPSETGWSRIEPGNPDRSTVVYRASVRDPVGGPYFNQMPPLLTHRSPDLAAVRDWIASLQ